MAQLKVSHISKAFDDQEILKDVTLELRDNEPGEPSGSQRRRKNNAV